MASSKTVAVRFTGDTKDFEQAVNRVEGKTGGLGKAFLGVGAAIGGAFAVSKITDFVGGSIAAFGEAEKVSKQTEAALKSTGNAAGVTAEHVGTLAHSLQNMSGMSDESIQSGQNLLLTFTNLQNKAGAGNNIFDQTSQIMVDMAARMGTDASGSAIQLGKALNDPVKGITALTRVGVSFTDQQKEQIKALVASGDTMGAQKIILAELNTEFGGSAKAMGDAMTPIERLRLRFGDFQEMVGSKVVPAIEAVAAWLGEKLPPVLAAIGGFVGPIIDDLTLFWNALRSGFTEDEGTGIERFALMLREDFLPVIQQIAAFIQDNWKPILIGLAAAFLLITSPVTAVIVALGLLYARFEVVRDVVGAVADFLTGTVAPAVEKFASYVIQQFSHLVDWVQQYWPQISEAIEHVMAVIVFVVTTYLNAFKRVWKLVGDDVLNYVGAVFDAIKVVVETAINIIRDVIVFVLALINGDWGKAWGALKQLAFDIWEGIKGLVGAGVNALLAILGGAVSLMLEAGKKLIGAVWAGIRWVWNENFEFFTGLPGRIVDTVIDGFGQLYELGKKIVKKIIDGIKSAAKGIGSALLDAIPGGGIIGDAAGAIGGLFKSSGDFKTSGLSAAAGGFGGPVVNNNIVVYDRSGNPQETARATVLHLRLAG